MQYEILLAFFEVAHGELKNNPENVTEASLSIRYYISLEDVYLDFKFTP